jgi:quinoprotein glucose dehydrogenase
LIFLAGGDMKIRAYDEATGQVLWTAKLPAESEGIPAMYEVGGRQYLVVNATLAPGGHTPAVDMDAAQPRGYVAFALPNN